MNQSARNCPKCGYNGFRTELRQVQVQFGANGELQLAGVASAVICEQCEAIHIPNSFNISPTIWTPPAQGQTTSPLQSAPAKGEASVNIPKSPFRKSR